MTSPTSSELSETEADGYARLALGCIGREFPNKIAHALNSLADVKSPRELTPAFYGCYDWHSAVHGHWVLVRLTRLFPEAAFVSEAKQVLANSFTGDKITQEVLYLTVDGRESFERPYGLSWLLQLVAELKKWGTPEALGWAGMLAPLEQAIRARLSNWLPKLDRPVRTGEHNNTAFSMGLMLDYARDADQMDFRQLLRERAAYFYLQDVQCPLNYEPSGEDFLSPCLAEADVMRRILSPAEFGKWLTTFLPVIEYRPTQPSDENDGKIGHLIGLNLSRAWMLGAIADALAPGDNRHASLRVMAADLREAGLRAINREQYQGAHWLGTFAVYLRTRDALR